MADKEGTKLISEIIVVSQVPCVCKTGPGMIPTPYQIISKFDKAVDTATSVNFTGNPVFKSDSHISNCIGNEPGTGGGIVSGVNKGVCRPTSWSKTVRVQGKWVVRHDDPFVMNCAGPKGPSNTIGKVIYIKFVQLAKVNSDGTIEVERKGEWNDSEGSVHTLESSEKYDAQGNLKEAQINIKSDYKDNTSLDIERQLLDNNVTLKERGELGPVLFYSPILPETPAEKSWIDSFADAASATGKQIVGFGEGVVTTAIIEPIKGLYTIGKGTLRTIYDLEFGHLTSHIDDLPSWMPNRQRGIETLENTGKIVGTLGSGIYDISMGTTLPPELSAEIRNRFPWLPNQERGKETLKPIWDGITQPIVNEWTSGNYGKASGMVVGEFADVLLGEKGISKIAKLKYLNKLADTVKALNKVDFLKFTDDLHNLGKLDELVDVAKKADRLDELIDLGKLTPDEIDKLKKAGKLTDEQAEIAEKAYRSSDGVIIHAQLKGENILLKNMKKKKIKYSKRTKKAREKLRNQFNNNEREAFLKDIANDPKKVEKLKKSGLTDIDMKLMKDGKVPDGFQVHHKVPLDDGGTNSFDNLVLMKNDPYHKALTNLQNSLTKGMKPGDTQYFDWPIADGFIYP